jgi:hypothetical protein
MSAVAKFEMAFVDFEDPDNEDDDGQKAEKAAPASHAQQDLKLESEDAGKTEHDKEMIRVRNSVKKIQSNLGGANSSIKRREGRIGDLKTLVKTQHGLAKKELNKVLLKSQSLLEKLQAYVKEGTVILDDK